MKITVVKPNANMTAMCGTGADEDYYEINESDIVEIDLDELYTDNILCHKDKVLVEQFIQSEVGMRWI
jgi:hypothetical protein